MIKSPEYLWEYEEKYRELFSILGELENIILGNPISEPTLLEVVRMNGEHVH